MRCSIRKKKADQKRIAVVSSYAISFVTKDIESIKKEFNVRSALFSHEKKKSIFVYFKNAIHIFRLVRWAEGVFVWFADFRGLITVMIARLLHRPAVVVVGGYEAAYVPEIHYGSGRNIVFRIRFWMLAKLAYVVLAVSKKSQRDIFQAIHHRATLLYNGVDTDFFYPIDLPRKKQVITTAFVKEENLVRKGLTIFVQAAALLPDMTFVVAGEHHDNSIEKLKAIASPNVTFVTGLTPEKLRHLYTESAVYAQLSAYESFGISLVEAMLCECVPVVFDRGALPEVVGASGIVVSAGNITEVVAAIKKARTRPGSIARDYALTHFSLTRRAHQLNTLLHEALCD